MSDVDRPDYKRTIWTTMREDLVRHVPAFEDDERLLCPICCRALGYDKFSIEHILPKQAVRHDPPDVREALSVNERSSLTLLCSETLVVNGKPYPKGCNGWKGRNFDPRIADLIKAVSFPSRFSDGHIIAFLAVGYLGIFQRYGYRVALTTGGLILRNQFFNPNRFTKNLPMTSQMILRADPRRVYAEDARQYWSTPVNVVVEGKRATVVIRNYSATIPLSHDPTSPISTTLPYAPQKYVFRPDLRTAFR